MVVPSIRIFLTLEVDVTKSFRLRLVITCWLIDTCFGALHHQFFSMTELSGAS